VPYKDIKKQRMYQREWVKRKRERTKEIRRKYRQRLRKRVIDKLGGKCVICECDEYKVLEINHINGGGRKEYKERFGNSQKRYHLAILNGKRRSDDLEIRCIVCNALHRAKDLNKAKGNWNIIWTSD